MIIGSYNGYNGYKSYTKNQVAKQAKHVPSSNENKNCNLVYDVQLRRDKDLEDYPSYSSEQIKRNNNRNELLMNSNQYIEKSSANMKEVDNLSDNYVNDWLNGDRSDEGRYKKSSNWNEVVAQIVTGQKLLVPKITKEIDGLLEENGVSINNDEQFNIQVSSGKIKVEGEDLEKAKQIEDILNNSERMDIKLHYITKQYSSEFNRLDESQQDLIFAKMITDYNIISESNGEISLSDLKLEDGKIVGFTPELEELYYGTKEGMSADLIEARKQSRKK